MPGLLKISDQESGDRRALSFDFRDLIALIPAEGPRLKWSIFPGGEGTEITGDYSSLGIDAASLWKEVDESSTGLILPWDRLLAFGEATHQTIWGNYIGCKHADTFSDLASLYLDDWLYLDRVSAEFYAVVEIAFQAIDSSFWLVYAQDDEVLDRIRNAFQDVETLRSW